VVAEGEPKRVKPERVKGPRRLKVVDPEIRSRFLAAVRNGSPLGHAANNSGWSDTSMFRAWTRGHDAAEAMAAGEPINSVDQAYYDFMVETKQARSAVAVRNTALIQKAAQGGYLIRERTRRLPGGVVETERDYAPVEWRAADRLLTISFGNEFRESRQLEISGPNGGPVQVESSSLREHAARLRQRILELEAREDDEDGIVDGEVVSDDSDIDF